MKNNKEIKELIIQQLKNAPIIQIACKKAGIGRATFYRWKTNDKKFAKAANEAIIEGLLFINDIAESQLISAIKDRNLTSIMFWLRHRHKIYSNKLEVTARLKKTEEKLTTEQKAIIKKALSLASLSEPIKKLNSKKHAKSKKSSK